MAHSHRLTSMLVSGKLLHTIHAPTIAFGILAIHTVLVLAVEAYLHVECLVNEHPYYAFPTHALTDHTIDVVLDAYPGGAFGAAVDVWLLEG